MTQTGVHTGPVAGRYMLHSVIGRGGAGAVWRGSDLALRRPVAVKQILLSEQHSTRTRDRAEREARAVAQVRSPGAVRLYDLVVEADCAYLVMELVDAPSLSRLVRRAGPLDPVHAARAGRSLVTTLAGIHRAGIVHRDVKPSNVLVDGATMRLTDFGIALLGDDPTLTSAGAVLGTPSYMAPEQTVGDRAGPATDLYGLGATLYFAVEGRAPFAASGSLETTRAVRDRPHRPGTRLGPLEGIVEALLSKDPAERPCAHAVATALAQVADDGTTTGDDGRPSSPVGRGGPPAAHTEPAASTGPAPDTGPTAGVRTAADARSGTYAGAPAPDVDDTRHARHALLWAAALVALLAVALLLLFLAIRGHPTAVAAAPFALVRSPAAVDVAWRAYAGRATQVEERSAWNR